MEVVAILGTLALMADMASQRQSLFEGILSPTRRSEKFSAVSADVERNTPREYDITKNNEYRKVSDAEYRDFPADTRGRYVGYKKLDQRGRPIDDKIMSEGRAAANRNRNFVSHGIEKAGVKFVKPQYKKPSRILDEVFEGKMVRGGKKMPGANVEGWDRRFRQMTGNEKVKQKSLDFDAFNVEPYVQANAYNKGVDHINALTIQMDHALRNDDNILRGKRPTLPSTKDVVRGRTVWQSGTKLIDEYGLPLRIPERTIDDLRTGQPKETYFGRFANQAGPNAPVDPMMQRSYEKSTKLVESRYPTDMAYSSFAKMDPAYPYNAGHVSDKVQLLRNHESARQGVALQGAQGDITQKSSQNGVQENTRVQYHAPGYIVMENQVGEIVVRNSNNTLIPGKVVFNSPTQIEFRPNMAVRKEPKIGRTYEPMPAIFISKTIQQTYGNIEGVYTRAPTKRFVDDKPLVRGNLPSAYKSDARVNMTRISKVPIRNEAVNQPPIFGGAKTGQAPSNANVPAYSDGKGGGRGGYNAIVQSSGRPQNTNAPQGDNLRPEQNNDARRAVQITPLARQNNLRKIGAVEPRPMAEKVERLDSKRRRVYDSFA